MLKDVKIMVSVVFEFSMLPHEYDENVLESRGLTKESHQFIDRQILMMG